MLNPFGGQMAQCPIDGHAADAGHAQQFAYRRQLGGQPGTGAEFLPWAVFTLVVRMYVKGNGGFRWPLAFCMLVQ
ncbi:hypothetical protein CF149_07329 [Pseudomonas psychrophila]|nr:hypothetical protein CF149_07329 [Pseudomonas psychrophila]